MRDSTASRTLSGMAVPAWRIVPGELDADEGLQPQAQTFGIDFGAVAGNDPVTLQPLDPAQAGRRRKMHALGQFRIGQAAVALQLCQEQQVSAIQRRCGHVRRVSTFARNNIAPQAV